MSSTLAVSPVDAATPVQKCTAPNATTQAGSIAVSPGLNAHASIQSLTTKIHLFQCVPTATTAGSGNLTFKYSPPNPQTCSLVGSPHTVNTNMLITWKNNLTSSLHGSFAFTGSTRLINVSGTIFAGQFSGHTVTGQFRYQLVVSPHGATVANACANAVAPGKPNRISIVTLDIFRTKAFVVN